MSIESVMPSNHLILCHPLLLLPSIFPSIRVFSNESVLCIRWPEYWSFSFSISPSNDYSGLISFRIVCFNILAVQGTLKSLLQHYSSKASILRCSAFFTVQLSHPYMTTGKTIALTRRTLVGKVMYLLFNMLSRLVITFLPRSKHLLISWLQSPSAVILESVIKSLWIHSCQDITISCLSNYLSFWVNYISSSLSLVDGWQIRAHPYPVFTWDKRTRKWRPRQRRSRRRDIDGKIRYICLFTFQRCRWSDLIWLNSFFFFF